MSKINEVLLAERVLQAGAPGYLQRTEPVSQVTVAIRTLLGGETDISPTVRKTLIGRIAGKERPHGAQRDHLRE